jgi:hypothetical protein
VIRVSVSNLDLYQTFIGDDDFPYNVFLAQLRGETPRTLGMERGHAFALAMEQVAKGQHDLIQATGHAFAFTCDVEIENWPRREVRAEKDYGGIIVSARCDRVHGNIICDDKTTESWSNGGAEKYLDRLQPWFYLSIYGCREFRWHIWSVREIDLDENRPEVKHAWNVFEHHLLTQYAYPEMEEFCRERAIEYRDFALRAGVSAPKVIDSPKEGR